MIPTPYPNLGVALWNKSRDAINDSALNRWLVLILLSGLTFGTYWFQDCLGPLKGLFETELGFTSSQFGMLVSSTTWANLALMIIVGGMALDRWGTRRTGSIFGVMAVVGAFLVYFGSKGVFGSDKKTMLTVMIIGRILYGTGLETVCVMVSRAIVKWFKGYELALAMGINMAFGRLGSAGTNFFGLDIAGGSVSAGLSFAASLIGLGLIMFFVYLFFDVKFETKEEGQASKEDQFKFKDLIDLLTNRSFIFIALLCVAFYSAVFPFIQYAPDLLVNKFGFSYNMPDLTGMGFPGSTQGHVLQWGQGDQFHPLGHHSLHAHLRQYRR